MRRVRGDSRIVADEAIPLPRSWKFITSESQLQVAVSARDFVRYKLIYGFIGSISTANDMQDTETPLHVQVVAKLTFRYGSSIEERYDSHIYVRINAFASKACLDKSFECLTLGTPVCGVIDATDSSYKSAQLLG